MKTIFLASTLLIALAGPACAGCADGLKELDAALKAAAFKPDVKTQLQDMRSQAEKLCSAGNEVEAADVIAEAEAMLAAEAE